MRLGETLMMSVIAMFATGRWVAIGYRVMAYQPSLGHSHWNVMSVVLEGLLDAGHEVVCATLHPATDQLAAHPNYTHVDMTAAAAAAGTSALRDGRNQDLAVLNRVFGDRPGMVRYAVVRARTMCHALSTMVEMRDVLNGRRQFDVVVVESLFVECPVLSPDRLNASATVHVVPSAPVNWMPSHTGSPDHPSYLGTLLADHPTPVTFAQRLANALDYARTNLARWCRDYATADDQTWLAPPASMVLVNTHHSVEPARPLGPNVVEIGGIHLRHPKPLPRVSRRVCVSTAGETLSGKLTQKTDSLDTTCLSIGALSDWVKVFSF